MIFRLAFAPEWGGGNGEPDEISWFNQIWNDTYPRLEKMGRGFINGYCPALQHEVGDILQETYLKMFEKRAELMGKDYVSRWLYKTFCNLVYNRATVRKGRLKHTSEEEVDESTNGGTSESAEETFLRGQEESVKIMKEKIGDTNYENFIAYVYREISLEDLAARYGKKTPGAMKTQVSRWKAECYSALVDANVLHMLILTFSVTFDLFDK